MLSVRFDDEVFHRLDYHCKARQSKTKHKQFSVDVKYKGIEIKGEIEHYAVQRVQNGEVEA